MPREVIPALVAPLVTGLLAVLGVWLQDWRQRRDHEQKRQRTLTQAREQVRFIHAWVEAHREVAPSDVHEQAQARAQQDLEQAYVAATRSLTSMYEDHEPDYVAETDHIATTIGSTAH